MWAGRVEGLGSCAAITILCHLCTKIDNFVDCEQQSGTNQEVRCSVGKNEMTKHCFSCCPAMPSAITTCMTDLTFNPTRTSGSNKCSTTTLLCCVGTAGMNSRGELEACVGSLCHLLLCSHQDEIIQWAYPKE